MTPVAASLHLRHMMRTLWACVAVVAVAASAGAQSVNLDSIGPVVGATVPTFSAVDQLGRTQSLATLAGPKGLMLVFSRSADW